jgi:hypothetical protein
MRYFAFALSQYCDDGDGGQCVGQKCWEISKQQYEQIFETDPMQKNCYAASGYNYCTHTSGGIGFWRNTADVEGKELENFLKDYPIIEKWKGDYPPSQEDV